jgi:sulfur relay (sulfurtransferase) DsrC/TusE family protein
MAKKKGISPQEGRKWLEEYEGGKGMTKIAEDSGSDYRTIKNHIEMAREAREKAQGRRDFILRRIEEHQGDLLAEVDHLRKLLSRHVPIGLAPDDPVQKKIFDALKEHTQRLPVKKQFDDWDKALVEYLKHKEGVRIELEAEERKLISAIPKEVECYPWTPVILEVLESGLSFEEAGRRYMEEPADGKYKILWGSNILTRSLVTEDQKAVIKEAHKKLVAFAKKYTPQFQKYRQQLKEISDRLIDELDVLKIKRVVAGRCRYCPA